MQLDTHDIKINGERLQIAIILPYFNESLGQELLENTAEELKANQVKEENIKVARVAGALELPFAAQKLIEKHNPDAIIALGIVIRGETSHYDHVIDTTFDGLMSVQLKHNTPISFGILTCENLEQVKARINKNQLNKGKQIAQAALIQTQL